MIVAGHVLAGTKYIMIPKREMRIQPHGDLDVLNAFIGPLVFKHSVCPDADITTVVERFRDESTRMLKTLSLV